MFIKRKKKRKLKTLKDIRKHARRRFAERYDRTLSVEEYSIFCKMIIDRTNNVCYIKKESNIKTHWVIEFHDMKILAVYDKLRHGIVTFLPFDEKEE